MKDLLLTSNAAGTSSIVRVFFFSIDIDLNVSIHGT